MSIVVIGSLNVDHIMQVDELPRRGQTVFAGRASTAPGGKGANQAAAAARLGANVRMVGCVGEDPAGDAVLRSLQAFGVDISAVRRESDEPTGTAFITVSASGDNTIVVHRGANFALSPLRCADVESLIERANVLVTQLETPVETVAEALRIARRRGVTTILNPAPATPVPLSLVELADYLVPNEIEARLLMELAGVQAAKVDLSSPSAAIEAAASLARATSCTVVITLGAHGCACAENGGRSRVLRSSQVFALPAFKVKAIDTTAAGDAFVGALAYQLDLARAHVSGEFDVRAALRFASAAGALATTKVGAQPSLPARTDVERLLRSDDGGTMH